MCIKFNMPSFYYLYSKKYANFESMDKEKINNVFNDLKNRGLLKKNGSFYTGDSVFRIVTAYVFILFLLICLLRLSYDIIWKFDGWRRIVLILFELSLLLVIWAMWEIPSRLYWYRDRLVTKNFLGGNVHEFSYSNIRTIRRVSEYDERSKNYKKTINVYFLHNYSYNTISIDDDPRAREFFRSCFGNIFFDYVDDLCDGEYDLRLKFFARVLKRNASEYRPYVKERQCAVRYFLKLKTYRGQKPDESYFTKRLDFWLRQCNRDTMEKCVEDCRTMGREIMRSKTMDYWERLDLLTYFFECTYVEDGLVDEWELNLLSQIATSFEIQSWNFVYLKQRFEGEKQKKVKQENKKDSRQQKRYQEVCSNCKQEAYSLLKLKPGATLEEVKRAYRIQAKTCHPDTLPPNATDKEIEEATIRFRAITEAYNFLCAELSAEPVNVAR